MTKRSNLAQVIQHHWREAVPDDRLAHLIKDASRGLGRALQMRLAEHGVSFGHWTFLRILWNGDGMTQRALSDLAGVMEPTTFSAVKAMEKLGYVERRQKPGDRKQVFIHLTPLGLSLRDKLVPLAEEVNAVAVEGLGEREIVAMRKALLAIIDNLARGEEQAATDNRRIPSTREMAGRLNARLASVKPRRNKHL
jgi:DNA-binding MarR family transcriptional regulator